MGSTCQAPPRVFDDAEAQTIASLWAGWETGNASEAEAMAKVRVLWRKCGEKKTRIIDMLELPEIRLAIDQQLSPVRGPCPSCAALQGELQEAETKLTERERQTRKLIDDYETRLKEKARAARQHTKRHRGIGEFLGFAWGYPEWRMALVLTVMLGAPWVMAWPAAARYRWTPYALVAGGLALLLAWAAAEIDETGWAQLLIKLSLVGAGFAAVEVSPGAWLLLAVVALLTATRLIDNLCERALHVPLVAAVAAFFR